MYCSLGDNQSSVLHYIARRSWPIATPQAAMAVGNVKQCGGNYFDVLNVTTWEKLKCSMAVQGALGIVAYISSSGVYVPGFHFKI